MPPIKAPVKTLADFIPSGAFELVVPYFNQYTIHLTLTKDRASVLGNYRNPIRQDEPHLISVNGNLNAYSFLITLLHEIAHLITFVHYKHQVAPHGIEWKNNYKVILQPFIQQSIFPEDIAKAVINYCNNVKASTCGDSTLFKALKKYDTKDTNTKFVEELPLLSFFQVKDGTQFQILEKRRTRYKCVQVNTQKVYLFPAIYEVYPIIQE